MLLNKLMAATLGFTIASNAMTELYEMQKLHDNGLAYTFERKRRAGMLGVQIVLGLICLFAGIAYIP